MGIFDGIIGGLASAGTSLFNMFNQNEQNRITREREDNAVQRRVADLKAAGLNPVLAAGDPASAQPMRAATVDDPAAAARQAMSDANARTIQEATARKASAEADVEEYKATGMKELVRQWQLQPSSLDKILGPAGKTPEGQEAYFDPRILSAIADLQKKLGEGRTAVIRPEQVGAQTGLTGVSRDLAQQNLDFYKKLGDIGGAGTGAILQLLLKMIGGIK